MIKPADQRLAQTAPICIPGQAQVRHESKEGYQQIIYAWTSPAGWQYTARWHSVLPDAQIITFPSWQIERVRPGLGYGSDHHPRRQQVLTRDGRWIDIDIVHRAAWRLGHDKSKSGDRRVIIETHFKVKKRDW